MRANDVEYFAPARFDDELEIHVRVANIGRTSMTFEFAAFKVPDATLLVTAHQTLVFIDLDDSPPDPHPRRVPSAVRCRRLTPTSSCGRPSRSSPPGRAAAGPGSTSSRRRASCSGRRPARRNPSGASPFPCVWRDTRVAELAADGEVAQAELEAVAAAIADLCLVGWDTGGEVWQS